MSLSMVWVSHSTAIVRQTDREEGGRGRRLYALQMEEHQPNLQERGAVGMEIGGGGANRDETRKNKRDTE